MSAPGGQRLIEKATDEAFGRAFGDMVERFTRLFAWRRLAEGLGPETVYSAPC